MKINMDMRKHLDKEFSCESRIKSILRNILISFYTLRYPTFKVGKYFRLGTPLFFTKVEITFGDYCYLGPRTTISNPLYVGDMVLISSDFRVIGNDHGLNSVGIPMRIAEATSRSTAPTTIESEAWVGQGVTLLSGITIGRGAVVGAQSFVNKDVPAYSIVAGVPAKLIRTRFGNAEIALHESKLYEK